MLQMTNMRILSMSTEKRQQNAYQLNKELNLVPWETLVVRKNCADMKIASECNRKNPTNTNALKLKKGTKWIS